MSQNVTKCHKGFQKKSHKLFVRHSNANEFLSRMFHLPLDGVDHRLVDSKVSPRVFLTKKTFEKSPQRNNVLEF